MFKKEVAQAQVPKKRVQKAAVTRQKLFQSAMALFEKNGFEKTTMREIAKEAKVATGATYYYYPSKESIIFDFYQELHREHLLALGEFLKTEESFEKRLHRVIKLKIQLAEKHKSLSRALFRVAANPLSPLSPFGEETRQIRLEAFEAFEQIVHGAVEKIHPDLKQVLPEYLWMYQMGIILFWIYDQSEESKRTYQLIDQSIPLIVYLLKKLQSPLAAPIRKKVLTIMRNFKGNLMDKDTQLVSKKERKK